MTGFGRTGRMFAIEHESVIPDIMVLGKGLTGGYLHLAITLITEKIFSHFDGSIAEGKALAYGHSYTGNALGCVAAKASLEIFEGERVLEALQPKIEQMRRELEGLGKLAAVKEVRQCGFIAGIEPRESPRTDKNVAPDAVITLESRPRYVGRGGEKLEGALDFFDLPVEGKIALDIGASTGGFTDCLLQRGAAKVYAVDVGHDQLAWRIRNHPRVIVLEKLNARSLSRAQIPESIDLCLIDVSFI